MRLQDYDTSKRYGATLQSSTEITAADSPDEIRELVFDLEGGEFHFQVGQSVGVLVPGPHALGHDYHFRLYTIAAAPGEVEGGKTRIELCVKRCSYIDEYSGERYDGVASNYLCDLKPGEQVTLTGPYGLPFTVPQDKHANLLMVGMGTGIAPFRALVKHIYRDMGGWEGKVRLFYGARTGLEMIYMNNRRDDFVNYYDEETFQAFKVLSPRPAWDEPAALDEALEKHRNQVWQLISDNNTWVYLAGLETIRDMLDKVFVKMAGSRENWQKRKAELEEAGRWSELIY